MFCKPEKKVNNNIIGTVKVILKGGELADKAFVFKQSPFV